MFDTSQQTVIEYLVPTMRSQGYKYYIAYTDTADYDGYVRRSEPDLFLVFSKEKITASTPYKYSVPADSLMYECRTYNYSTSYNASNSNRIVSSSFSGNLNIDLYEHIYSNAEYSTQTVQPDIMKGETTNAENLWSIGIILSAFLLFTVFWKMATFRK